MTTRLVDTGWSQEIAEGLRVGAGELRIISPFIKALALKHVLPERPRNVSVITRFNLADFAAGISDIAALRRLLDCGAAVIRSKSLAPGRGSAAALHVQTVNLRGHCRVTGGGA
jgi:hypothetical protein